MMQSFISLYSQVPSDLSNNLSHELGRGLLEILDALVFIRFSQPKRLLWFLFEETAVLGQYRLRYPESPYLSSNTGLGALRKIFELNLYQLRELYL